MAEVIVTGNQNMGLGQSQIKTQTPFDLSVVKHRATFQTMYDAEEAAVVQLSQLLESDQQDVREFAEQMSEFLDTSDWSPSLDRVAITDRQCCAHVLVALSDKEEWYLVVPLDTQPLQSLVAAVKYQDKP